MEAEFTHGTLIGYRKHGCRCRPCVKTNYAALRRWRDRVRGGPVPATVHGTTNGYGVYGCRCEPCKAAMTASWRQIRKRRRRMRELAARGLPADWDGEL